MSDAYSACCAIGKYMSGCGGSPTLFRAVSSTMPTMATVVLSTPGQRPPQRSTVEVLSRELAIHHRDLLPADAVLRSELASFDDPLPEGGEVTGRHLAGARLYLDRGSVAFLHSKRRQHLGSGERERRRGGGADDACPGDAIQ